MKNHTENVNPVPTQRVSSSTSSQRSKAGRRHAARKTRVAAAGLSVMATGLIAGVFSHQDQASATTVATSSKSFTGDVATNRWGAVQVKVAVSNDKIVNITNLQLPNSKPKSVRLSNMAVNAMKPAIIRAQSTNVDAVSGATMTSRSYAESVQSAIDKARAAGALT